jgi:hypothetical protein
MTPAPNVAEKNRTKGVARLRFCVARAAEGGDAVTVLLCDVLAGFIFILLTLFLYYFLLHIQI